MDIILELDKLTKQYKTVTALNGVSLTVQRGMVFGVLGPNGSGKTTMLSIILSAIFPNRGTYTWFNGKQDTEARKQIGALLEKPNFLPNLNAINNLKMVANIKGVSHDRISEALKQTGLYDRRTSKFSTYSLGMKQRLALASVLLADPEVLVLDEPTNGLDPQGIVDIRNLIIQLSRSGKTIILASHMLDEVEKVCTHVAILKTGKLVGTYQVGEANGTHVKVEVGATDNLALHAFLKELTDIQELIKSNDNFVFTATFDYDLAELNRKLMAKNIHVNHLRKISPNLESAFLSATGGKQ
jgi:ABC-2 type transport system ATP-binding protein